ncbi:MAG TPA: UDP-N-acetylglucosamine acyltransferase [Rhodospirillaceae bacterium]|nr:UDP-N-acetylglucosamine acyltransferase [Rhodospirillaceae bacterium]MAX61166.1 UDP-N-acetylglucosamine acyltransferase [Rhodospirillaceae bacterium]MBB55909.1 UDP-N-acetylglucosamine acyltransferase [Rhodospirillaceae bacterium]HAE02252.1 UDP-N-acetylglucosamine acyltransferase [Rhodospirillaceae bacterium]
MRQLKLLILALTLVTGCTQIPPVDFMVQDVGPVSNRKDAELKSITVGFAPQEQQKTVQADASIPPVWKEALTDAINRSLIFKDDQETKVNLSVRVVEFDVPEVGITMTTKVGAIYEVIDRSSGALLFSDLIESEGVVPGDYAFVGMVRAVESWNRGVRNNIAQFILRLEDADFSKPVFLGQSE